MSIKKTFFTYLSCSIALFVFQSIYHLFCHGVVSIGLKYVWILPLLGGLIVLLLNFPLNFLNNRFAFNLYNSGLAFIINAVILQGILDIAGSDSPYVHYFYLLATILLAISLVSLISKRLLSHLKTN